MDTLIREKTVVAVEKRPLPIKTLALVASGSRLPDRSRLGELEAADQFPRTLLFEQVLNSDILDERVVVKFGPSGSFLYKVLPAWLGQILYAYKIMERYDVVISWTSCLALVFAFLLKLTGRRHPHVALLAWISRPKKALLLRLVNSHIDKLILWSSVQRKYAVNDLGIPHAKVALLGRRVDHLFWRPLATIDDMICSAGQEMRDYRTLIEAMRTIDIPCHIATGAISGKIYATVKVIGDLGPLPPNVRISLMSPVELRNLYARSRFVVVPLLESDTDNGSTVIEEAMAMGKAVICTRTQGQVDLVEDGITGIYVPPRDVKALRAAIEFLWKNPGVAKTLGMNGRKKIVKRHTFDRFVTDVKEIVDQVLRERNHTRRQVVHTNHRPGETLTITLIRAGIGKPPLPKLERMEASDQSPRITLYEKVLNSDMLDEKFLETIPSLQRGLYKMLPVNIVQVLEAFRVRKKYDAIISWAEYLGLPLAA